MMFKIHFEVFFPVKQLMETADGMIQSLSYDPEVAVATAPTSQLERCASKASQTRTRRRNRTTRWDPELIQFCLTSTSYKKTLTVICFT